MIENNTVINGFGEEVDKEEYDKACREQVDDVCRQNSIKHFRRFCHSSGWDVTYKNYQIYLTKSDEELGYEILDWDLQKRLTREYEEEDRKYKPYEWEVKLEADGYRKVTLSVKGKEPMEKWILRTTQPLKDNCVVFKCEGDEEIFGLIEDEDLPTFEFYLFENDEEVEYTSEELERWVQDFGFRPNRTPALPIFLMNPSYITTKPTNVDMIMIIYLNPMDQPVSSIQ